MNSVQYLALGAAQYAHLMEDASSKIEIINQYDEECKAARSYPDEDEKEDERLSEWR